MKKTCIVTGASKGIGRGIATVLARDEGYVVYATARTESKLVELASSIESNPHNKGGCVIPVVVDHSSDESTKKLIDRAFSETGRIDVLVNNAYGGVFAIGETFGKKFWEKPLSVWDASHNVGLRSHYITSALSVPYMIKNKSGLIINISSPAGKGYLFDIAYGVGKQAVDRLSCDMATELQGTGVNVLTLWPGAVNTESTTFPGAETPEFSGKAIASLIRDPACASKYNGKIIQTRELADMYNFCDIDGKLPATGNSQLAMRKAIENATPIQWQLNSKLPKPADPAMKIFFQRQGKL